MPPTHPLPLTRPPTAPGPRPRASWPPPRAAPPARPGAREPARAQVTRRGRDGPGRAGAPGRRRRPRAGHRPPPPTRHRDAGRRRPGAGRCRARRPRPPRGRAGRRRRTSFPDTRPPPATPAPAWSPRGRAPLHGDGRAPPEGATGKERGQRWGHRQGAPRHRSRGPDPGGQPRRAGCGAGGCGRRRGKRTYVRTLARVCALCSGRNPQFTRVERDGDIGTPQCSNVRTLRSLYPSRPDGPLLRGRPRRGRRPRAAELERGPDRPGHGGAGPATRGRRRTAPCPRTAGASSPGGPRTPSRPAGSSTPAARR